MNYYVPGTFRNPTSVIKQRRHVRMTPIERIRQKKKVSFKMKEDNSVIEDYILVEECRSMFRKEILVLGHEVVKFREECERELAKYKSKIELEKVKKTLKANEKTTEESSDKPPKNDTLNSVNGVQDVESTELAELWSEKMKGLQEDMAHLSRRQSQLDMETSIADQEDGIFEKKTELEKYEEEINSIEFGLDRRQSMCQKRQNDLLALEEELDNLKLDLEKKKDTLDLLGVDSNEAKNRATKNWDHIHNNLLEKQSFLQKKVDQYRTDLATLKSTCTAKDISIQKLQTKVEDLQDGIQQRDAKIEQLTTQLSFVLEETKKSNPPKPLSRENSKVKLFARQKSFKKQTSHESEDRDKLENLVNVKTNKSHRKSVKHPMRQSVDVTGTGFQMGIKPPSANQSKACVVM